VKGRLIEMMKANTEIINKDTIDDLRKVKKYLNSKPLASVLEVNEKTGVSVARIMLFIKNGIIKLRPKYDFPLKKVV
jgi:tmRNA-binding protein